MARAEVRSAGPHYRHDIRTGAHALVADEPFAQGGLNAGPAPFDYVLAGLGACTAITLRMYAEKKRWELGELTVGLELQRDIDGNTRVQRTLRAGAVLDDEQWTRLLDIAARTPVTLALQNGMTIATRRAGAG
ncbi:osmotically inducible protein C [Frateuria sp. Soil773]|nr:osmotically inducible protein C [Frateuria sp. Soil773]